MNDTPWWEILGSGLAGAMAATVATIACDLWRERQRLKTDVTMEVVAWIGEMFRCLNEMTAEMDEQFKFSASTRISQMPASASPHDVGHLGNAGSLRRGSPGMDLRTSVSPRRRCTGSTIRRCVPTLALHPRLARPALGCAAARRSEYSDSIIAGVTRVQSAARHAQEAGASVARFKSAALGAPRRRTSATEFSLVDVVLLVRGLARGDVAHRVAVAPAQCPGGG